MKVIVVLLSVTALAEEKSDLGARQRLKPDTVIRVDILDPVNETIRWDASIVDPVTSEILPLDVDLLDPLGTLLGTFPSGSDLLPTGGIGAYELRPADVDLDLDGFAEPLEEWAIAVEVLGVPVDGRVWSTRWRIDAGGFSAATATDGSFYAVVEGGTPLDRPVVEIKADGFAGFEYTLRASEEGILGGQGRSRYDTSLWIAPSQYPIYLRPPDPAVVSYTWLPPVITNAALAPEGQCAGIAPGLVGAGATVTFDSNVDGVLHLVCDIDHDGVFDLTSDDDFHLLTPAVPGANAAAWDGTDNVGTVVPPGTVACLYRLTVGEFHYVAGDTETSYEGFRMFEVDPGGSRTGLAMYWNDAEVQANDIAMPDFQFGLESSGPFGVDSGPYTDPTLPNVNARSWGAFQSVSKGNEAYLDTYTWLGEAETAPFDVEVLDLLLDSDADLLPDANETCLAGTDPFDPDTDADGLGDHAEVTLGVSDALDDDSDDDGVGDGTETPDPYAPETANADGDVLPDVIDPDDDGDGLPTLDEGTADPDGDLLPNYLDDDSDGDGASDAVEGTRDTDETDPPDVWDTDDDDDGVATLGEDVDLDGDPMTDDTDGDLTPDFRDADDDGDGIPTLVEGTVDTDDDGFPDYLDADDDGDGIPTLVEGDVALHPFPTDLKVICVASDHSPVCMGLMFNARQMALQTCYLQHAPVNRHFPPLNYNLSILFDQASVQAYKQSAADRGLPFSAEIVLLTPFDDVFERLPPKSSPFVIGICLSFFPDIPALTSLIAELLGNANVDHIAVRKHPRSTLDYSAVSALSRVKFGPSGQSGKDFFESVDVVLVPNSGVTVEALHSGRPTFFLPVADKISEKVAHDYYGFVEAGILPVFNSSVLASHASLTGFFDSAWLSRFELYDETVTTPLEDMRDRVREKFAELLNG